MFRAFMEQKLQAAQIAKNYICYSLADGGLLTRQKVNYQIHERQHTFLINLVYKVLIIKFPNDFNYLY